MAVLDLEDFLSAFSVSILSIYISNPFSFCKSSFDWYSLILEINFGSKSNTFRMTGGSLTHNLLYSSIETVNSIQDEIKDDF